MEFERAVAERIRTEGLSHLDLQAEVKLAQKQEHVALLNRSIHISRCGECWVRPPS